MGGFILGVAIALFVGMRLARHIDGSKGARAGYKKANTDLPGARKKMYSTTFGLIRFLLVLSLIVVAMAYGWIRANSGGG
jgi:nitrogen fixation/metabolism regulation signal transduction histidine kinase